MKKKISRFEFAIMQTVTPDESKEFEPMTEDEELDIRQEKLMRQVNNLRIKIETP